MKIVKFLFYIIWLSWPIYGLPENPAIAKSGCEAQCGDVSIPYPFGIGANCFIDEWFEIFCNKSSSPHTPSLNRMRKEVLNISVNGTIRVTGVKLYIGDCSNREDCPFLGLEGSPFFFSQTTGDSVGIPVVLEWGLYNHTLNDIGMNNSTANTPTSFCITSDSNATLSSSNATLPSSNASISFSNATLFNQSRKLECFCERGYDGNPYLLQGCQDIDECQNKSRNPCSYWSEHSNQSYECINYPGTYRCRFKHMELPPPKESKSKMIAIGICTGVVGLLFLLVGAWRLHKVIKKRKDTKLKQKFFKRNGGLLLQQQLASGEVNVEKIKMFNSKELEKATEYFNVDRMLGQGGQGTVYKGMLIDGRIVAVKKSKVVDEGKQLEQFINEVVILSQINHRNVVKILGCCLETEVPLLVYEFIPNGTLFQYLHDQNEEFPLTWDVRLRIATEVAGALSYLHYAASLPIYHRDIKSANILLDDKYRAKVADFGTSRSAAIDQTHVTTLHILGTYGYLDPEYFQSSQFTDKSDVYSFGVVLVELLTGLKPIQGERSLATHFIVSMEENHLFDILDAQVMKEDRKEEVMVVAKLAKRCLNLNGKKRPTMKEVTVELEGIQKSEKAFNDSQNLEEVEYVRTEMIEPWDVTSTSTGSGLDSGIASSFDTKPLISKK